MPFVTVKRGGAGVVGGNEAGSAAEGEGGGAVGTGSASTVLAGSAGVATAMDEGAGRLAITRDGAWGAHAAVARTRSEANVGAMRVLT